jgi:plasmid maintenance system antidote protein VapI
MNRIGRPQISVVESIENDFLKSFITEIETYMKENNKDQTFMAEGLGLHKPAFNRILKGSNVTAETIQKVLTFIGKKVEFH